MDEEKGGEGELGDSEGRDVAEVGEPVFGDLNHIIPNIFFILAHFLRKIIIFFRKIYLFIF